jgi:hypothetical protein
MSCGGPAAQKLGRENPGQTLQATALVHEAYSPLIRAKIHKPLPFIRSGSRSRRRCRATTERYGDVWTARKTDSDTAEVALQGR